MADLNFKYGPYSRLPAYSAETEGTVYVTTDEKSMYVNLDGKQIRIQGAIQYYESVEDFAAGNHPPYATDVLYFFRKMKDANGEDVAANALMAYDGTNWVQINVSQSDFTSLKGTVNDHASAIQTLSSLPGRVKTNEEGIQANADAIAALQGLVGGGETGEGNTIFDKVETLEEKMGSAETAINGLQTAVQGIETNASDIAALDGRVTQNETYIEELQGNVSGLTTRVGTAEGNITALQTATENNNTAISGLQTTIPLLATKQEVSDLGTSLTDKINEDIAAANAMTYKGSIENPDELNSKVNVKIGDTWVLTQSINGTAAAGDLYVASGEETDGFISSPNWTRVQTGYDSSLDPELVVDASNPIITLKNFAGTELGKFGIAGDGKNIQVSIANGVIKVQSVWGTF